MIKSEIFGFDKRIQLLFDQNGFSVIYNKKEFLENGTSCLNNKTLKHGVIKSLKTIQGQDTLGRYNSIHFDFYGNKSKTLEINCKLYLDAPIMIYENTIQKELNLSKRNFCDSLFDFLQLRLSSNKYKVFSYTWKCWPTPVFFELPSSEPIEHFSSILALKKDDDVLVLSPANNFTASYVKLKPPLVSISSNGEANLLKKGMTFSGIGVFGEKIKDTIIKWGNILLRLYGKPKVNWHKIPFLKSLGYFTDHGAYYYYKKEEDMDYTDTLVNLDKNLQEKRINAGYYQIDSWWYSKGKDQGVLTWDKDPKFLPGGIRQLGDKLEKPVLLHNRYFSSETPLACKFKFFADNETEEVVWIKMEETIKRKTMGKYPLDSYALYHELAKKVSPWNCIGYEQDWLDTQFALADKFRSNLGLGDTWLEQMSKAFEEFNIPIFYAMPTTGCYLATVRCPNVVSIRTSDDYYFRKKHGNEKLWYQNFYCSELAYALSLYPNFDVFITNKQHPNNFEEPYAEEEALARALSCGVIAFGDKFVDKEIINRLTLPDGTLLKPDRPALPIEKHFESNPLVSKEPLIVYTASKIGKFIWYYIGVWNLCKKELEYEVAPAEWEIDEKEKYIIYDWFKREVSITGKKILCPYKADFYILAPLIDGEFTFIGDIKRYIGCSAQLVKKIEFDPAKIVLMSSIDTKIKTFLFFKKECRLMINKKQIEFKKRSNFIDLLVSKNGTTIRIL